jgi:alpha-galactosidase
VWCQPERVSPGTWPYELHPQWLLGPDGGDKLLNFGNPEAWQWAVEHFTRLIQDQGIDIYRQDMNIDPVGFWRTNDGPDRQGITEINHVNGYLAYLDAPLLRTPGLRIDHFRIDLETLRRAAPLILGIDFEPVGDQCHNYRLSSWLPWHGLCSRIIATYDFRSMMCPAIVSGWDLRRQDLDYSLARRLVHEWEQIAVNYLGDFYPLTPYSLQNDTWMAWQFDRPESGEGIVQAFRRRDNTEKSRTFKLQGLNPQTQYTIMDFDRHTTRTVAGRELAEHGLTIHLSKQPDAAVIAYLKHR